MPAGAWIEIILYCLRTLAAGDEPTLYNECAVWFLCSPCCGDFLTFWIMPAPGPSRDL